MKKDKNIVTFSTILLEGGDDLEYKGKSYSYDEALKFTDENDIDLIEEIEKISSCGSWFNFDNWDDELDNVENIEKVTIRNMPEIEYGVVYRTTKEKFLSMKPYSY